MKTTELQKIVDENTSNLKDAVADIDAPIEHLIVSRSLNKTQRRQGCVARLCVVLADKTPGWRSKDEGNRRQELKHRLRETLKELTGMDFAVLVQAGYSCLATVDGGVARRDGDGNTTGIYAE